MDGWREGWMEGGREGGRDGGVKMGVESEEVVEKVGKMGIVCEWLDKRCFYC